MSGNFEVAALCCWYLMPNSSRPKLKSPMFIVALFLRGATARAFHSERSWMRCQTLSKRSALPQRMWQTAVFYGLIQVWFSKSGAEKPWRYFPNQSVRGTQQGRWHVSTQWRSTVQEKSRSYLDPTLELFAPPDATEWLSKTGPPPHPSLPSLSSLVTINPPQTGRNPICSNK